MSSRDSFRKLPGVHLQMLNQFSTVAKWVAKLERLGAWERLAVDYFNATLFKSFAPQIKITHAISNVSLSLRAIKAIFGSKGNLKSTRL